MVEFFAALQGFLLVPVPPRDAVGYADHVMLVGHVLWILTYALILARGHRDQLLGIPLIAVCLNISWEVLMYFDCYALGVKKGYCLPFVSGEWGLALATILCLDALIVLQAVIFLGRRIGAFLAIVLIAAGVAAALAAQVALILAMHDWRAVIDTWLSNLVMSVLFIALVVRRPQGEGLSFAAALAKLLGSLAVITAIWLDPSGYVMVGDRAKLIYSLAALVFVADVIYAAILWRRQPQTDLTA